MNKLKTGIFLIIIGNVLYLSYIFFTGNETSSFGEFTKGLLLGVSVGANLVGIILSIIYAAKEKNEKNKFLIRFGGVKMYKTVVIEYSPKADDMAQKVEEKANEMLQDGYELITMSITGTAKAILVFKKQVKNQEFL